MTREKHRLLLRVGELGKILATKVVCDFQKNPQYRGPNFKWEVTVPTVVALQASFFGTKRQQELWGKEISTMLYEAAKLETKYLVECFDLKDDE